MTTNYSAERGRGAQRGRPARTLQNADVLSREGTPSAAAAYRQLERYVAKPEVAEFYSAIKTSAQVIDKAASKTVDFLTKPSIAAVFPSIAQKLGKLTTFAKLLGPAGEALGLVVDLLSAFGFMKDPVMAKLDKISQQIQDLRDDVKKGFQDVKAKLDTNRALLQFLPVFNKLRAQVQIYEQNVAGVDADAYNLYKRLGDMDKDYPPGAIILDLKQMHNLITGNAQFGKPLFEQLAKEGNEFEGDAFDEFMANLFIQFQLVIALEIRAVRMLRSLLAISEKDLRYGNDLKAIFTDLSVQRSEYDPVSIFDWYLNFRSSGGKFKIDALRPACHLYMDPGKHGYICGQKADPGPQGKFDITPCVAGQGTFLVKTKSWSDYYMDLKADEDDAYAESTMEASDPRCHWYFHIKDMENKVFTLSTAQWPSRYMYASDHYVRASDDVEKHGLQAQFKLIPLAQNEW